MANPRVPRKKAISLNEINKSQRVVEKYAMKPVKGRPLRADFDNIGEVIAEVEGNDYR
jgi:hypothetical protein